MQGTEKREILPLTGLRFVAAFYVFGLYHIYLENPQESVSKPVLLIPMAKINIQEIFGFTNII